MSCDALQTDDDRAPVLNKYMPIMEIAVTEAFRMKPDNGVDDSFPDRT